MLRSGCPETLVVPYLVLFPFENKNLINLIFSPYKGKNIATALKWLPRPVAERVLMVFLIAMVFLTAIHSSPSKTRFHCRDEKEFLVLSFLCTFKVKLTHYVVLV